MSIRDPLMFPNERKIIRQLPLVEGQTLIRIRRLLYPVLLVEVDVLERYADDFSELERAIERLVDHGITYQCDLLELLGLSEKILSKFLRLLEGIGHIKTNDAGRVWLTPLGCDSVRDNKKYQQYQSRQVVLCDGMTGKPLPRDYYALRLLSSMEVDAFHFTEIVMPEETFNTEILEKIRQSPRDYYYNLVDEIEDFGEIHKLNLAFIPVLAWYAEDEDGEPQVGIVASEGRKVYHLNVDFIEDIKSTLFPELSPPDLAEIADVLYNAACLDEQRTTYVSRNSRILPSDLEVTAEGNIIWYVTPRCMPLKHSTYMALAADQWDAEPQGFIARHRNEGRLVYCWSSDQELLREAYCRQAISKLNRLYLGGHQLVRDEVVSLVSSIAEKLNVTPEFARLIEYARDNNYEILAHRLAALFGADELPIAVHQ